MKSYAKENRLTPVRANLVDPGTLRTKMRAQYAPGEDPQTVTPPEELVPVLLELAAPDLQQTGQIYDFGKRCWREG